MKLRSFLDEMKPHTMGLNETKLDSSIGDDEWAIEGSEKIGIPTVEV